MTRPTGNVSHFRHDYNFFRVRWAIHIRLESRSSYKCSYGLKSRHFSLRIPNFRSRKWKPSSLWSRLQHKVPNFSTLSLPCHQWLLEKFETLFFRLLLRIDSMSSRFLSARECLCSSEGWCNSFYMPRSWGTENHRNYSAAYSNYMAALAVTFFESCFYSDFRAMCKWVYCHIPTSPGWISVDCGWNDEVSRATTR